MNATNRGLNRSILFGAGIVLVAVGAAAVSPALWSRFADAWLQGADAATAWMHEADETTRLNESTPVSWFALAVLAVLLAVVVVACVIVARLGGGKSRTVIRQEAGDGAQGAVTVGHGFAVDAFTHALAGRPEILSFRVAARKVRGADVLHVSVTPRQQASPREVAETIGQLTENLSMLLGRETPTLVTIRSGIRSRLSADGSRVQ